MTKPAGNYVDAYLATLARMEPDISPVDLTAAAASIAISLKRIADAFEAQNLMLITNDEVPDGTLDPGPDWNQGH